MKVLVVVVDAGGNVPPALGVAAELQRRGEQVTVLGHRALRAAVERAGLRFEELTTAGDFDPRRRGSTLRGLVDVVALVTDRRIGDDALAVVRRDGVDVAVVDTLASGAIARLVAAGVPTLSLVHYFHAYSAVVARGPVGLLARLRGVDIRRVQASAAGRIVTARPDLDPAGSDAGVHHVGAVWQGTPVAATPATPPRVLVSLSTTSFPGQERTLQTVLDAVGRLPVAAVVTTGPTMDPAAFRVPPNAAVHRWLDHGEVLATTSLVVGHGGHGTAMRALSYGVPVLVIPSHDLMDQPLVGQALTRAGVGAVLARRASTDQVATTVAAMLADSGLHERAAALGADIRERDGAAAAADVVQRAGGAAPVRA